MMLLLGMWLTWKGFAGRAVDDHPLCRRCAYDLVGAIDRPSVCPECGLDLTRASSVRVGHRQRRILLLVPGAMLLLFALGSSGLLARAHFTNFDWNTIKPVWMLRRELTGAKPVVVSAVQNELLARLNASTLTSKDIQWIVGEGLRIQADSAIPWQTFWGDFIQSAWQRGDVGNDVISQYLKVAIEGAYGFKTPRKIRRGAEVPLIIGLDSQRVGRSQAMQVSMIQGPIMLDHRQQLTDGHRGGIHYLSSSGRSSGGSKIRPDIPLGKHVLSMDVTCRGGRIQPAGDFGPTDDDASLIVAEWYVHLEKEFEVVPADAQVIAKVKDDSKAAALQQCISVEQVNASRTLASCMPRIDAPPVDVAFDVLWRHDGAEGWLAGITQRAGRNWRDADRELISRSLRTIPEGVASVDLVFRSNPQLAETSSEITEIWDGQIIIKDVPVKWAKESPATRKSQP
jgi:hypothetical protein